VAREDVVNRYIAVEDVVDGVKVLMYWVSGRLQAIPVYNPTHKAAAIAAENIIITLLLYMCHSISFIHINARVMHEFLDIPKPNTSLLFLDRLSNKCGSGASWNCCDLWKVFAACVLRTIKYQTRI
jgi:hypothetical protein